MSSIAITFAIVAAMVALFATNLIPVAVTALAGALALYATGVLDLRQALAGFGDPTVLFIAALLVVSASLEASGVTAWVGQTLIRHAGTSHVRLLVLTMLLAAGLTALIGASGTVAALLPVLILVAIRLGRSPSQLLMPLVFAAHAGSMLVLTGSLVNLVVSDAATEQGLPPLGYFELTSIGIPLLAGTILLVVLLGGRLLPVRTGRRLPEDLSRHARTLAEQYSLFDRLFELELRPDSADIGAAATTVGVADYPGLSLIAVQDRTAAGVRHRTVLAAGDTLLVRGDAEMIARLAADRRLLIRSGEGTDIGGRLFNSAAGFAEVLIPPRSELIGQSMFPGMITPSGDLVILAIQRRGETMGPGETVLAAGDTLLLQGSWTALDEHLSDPDVLVVDSPDLVRRQAIPMGAGARRAIFVLASMVLLLATGMVPAVVAGLLAACAVILLRVLKIEQAYRAVNWTAIIMVASLIPLSTAMYRTGAASLMADLLVRHVGGRSPHALLAGLFVLAAGLGQLISSTATALIVIPVAVAAAHEIGVAPRTTMITVAVAAAASFLTPIAATANLMVQGPGGYRFGDYWRLGLPLLLWFFVVATVLVPMVWPLAPLP